MSQSPYRPPYLLIFITLVLLFGGIVLYVKEFYYFNRTFALGRMVGIAMVVGLLVGWLIYLRMRRFAEDGVDRMRVFAFCVIPTILFMPLIASLSNRLLSSGEGVETPVSFVSQEPFLSDRGGLIKGEKIQPSGCRLFFYEGEKLHRIINNQCNYGQQHRGDTIVLELHKGLWGVTWVAAE